MRHLKRKPVWSRIVLVIALAVFISACVNLTGSGGEPELYFTILHTNDEHSNLLPDPLVDYHPDQPNPSKGGFARVAAAVKKIRALKAKEDEPVLLISGGDYLGGSPFAWLALDGYAAELSLMIDLGYDVVTIGNHEFDFGDDVLAAYLQAAGYPDAAEKTAIVSSNILPPVDHSLGEMGIRDTYIRELSNGLKLGFFGLIGKDAILMAPFAGDIQFSDQHTAAAEAVASLRAKGVDLVIAVTHMGIEEEQEMARAVEGIDIIVGGHSHTFLYEPVIVGQTILLQSGDLYKNLGVTEFAYDPASGKLRLRNSENGRPHLLPIDSNVTADPEFEKKLAAYTDRLNDLINRMTDGRFTDISEIVVYSDFELPIYDGMEAPMGNFVTDAMRIAAEEALGETVHFAFQASGPIRGGIVPGVMPYSRGAVSFYDLAKLVGLGTGPDKMPGFPIISAYFTAAEVKKIMEISVFLSQYMGEDYFLQASGLRASYDMDRGVINIPIVNQLVPTTRGILSLELFTGDGIQPADTVDYVPLSQAGEKLYHVATDFAIATAIPLVGEEVPYLLLKPKDKDGNPVAIEERVVIQNGRELKMWQAVMEHAARQPLDADGAPRIAESYRASTGRLIESKGSPLWIWPAAALVLLAGLIAALVGRKKKKRAAAG